MQGLRSPLLPLAGAVAASAAPWAGSGVVAAALAGCTVYTIWRWWVGLVITIDGIPYKGLEWMPPKPNQKKRVEVVPKEAKDGFLTPREDAKDTASCSQGNFVEWAPFAPSLPLGAPSDGEGIPYWLECEASVFDVRNICYKQTGEKVCSEFALYDCVGMDMIRDKRRIDGVMNLLTGGPTNLPKTPEDTAEWSASWGVPRVVIVNCQLPYKAGNLMAAHPEDDGGLSIMSYFVLSQQSSALLAAGDATPSLRLWRRFVEAGVSTKEGIPFKVVGRVEDLEKYEVPESFHRFNNKPVLLTKSAKVLTSRLPEVIEIDYDVRGWIYPARSALANYHHRSGEAELEIGYLVQGQADDELPEQILGCFKLNLMDITKARWVSLVPP